MIYNKVVKKLANFIYLPDKTVPVETLDVEVLRSPCLEFPAST